MPEEKTDRRVRRTKRRLKQALLELIEQGDYDRVTVEDITARADVGRSTFYTHFTSKDHLLFAGFDEWLLSLADTVPAVGASDRFRFSLPLLEHVREQRRFARAVFVGAGDANVRRRFTTLLVELIGRELDRMTPQGSGDTRQLREARAHSLAGAFLGLVSWWIQVGLGPSPETVDRVFQQVAHGTG